MKCLVSTYHFGLELARLKAKDLSLNQLRSPTIFREELQQCSLGIPFKVAVKNPVIKQLVNFFWQEKYYEFALLLNPQAQCGLGEFFILIQRNTKRLG